MIKVFIYFTFIYKDIINDDKTILTFHQIVNFFFLLFFLKIIRILFLECSQGMYGSGCQKNCSENCLYDGECNRTTGKCDAGCKPGYKGAVCDTGLIT